MSANGHFGAMDTEPKYDVRDAIREFKRVPETMAGRWELYSSYVGVGPINRQIAKAVNVAIALTKNLGFGAKALEEAWDEIADCSW